MRQNWQTANYSLSSANEIRIAIGSSSCCRSRRSSHSAVKPVSIRAHTGAPYCCHSPSATSRRLRKPRPTHGASNTRARAHTARDNCISSSSDFHLCCRVHVAKERSSNCCLPNGILTSSWHHDTCMYIVLVFYRGFSSATESAA